jgi:hypothetical protein
MTLNVVASMGPDNGALLVAGTSSASANDRGARSSLDAMTIPTTTDTNAMSDAKKKVDFRLDIQRGLRRAPEGFRQ